MIRQLNPLQQIGYGELDVTVSERVRAVDAAMQGLGFDAVISTKILPDMWDKWVQLASLGVECGLGRRRWNAINPWADCIFVQLICPSG